MDYDEVFNFGASKQVADSIAALRSATLPMQDIAKQIGASNATILKDALTVNLPVTKIVVPELKIDYSSLFPNWPKVMDSFGEQMRPLQQIIETIHREQFADLFKTFREALESTKPPNWQGMPLPPEAVMEMMLLDEGLALAWVPNQKVLSRLVGAASAQERRAILGSCWKSTLTSCKSLLQGVGHPQLQRYAKFGLDAADAISHGNPAASQALSANLLDSILRKEFSSTDRRTITKQDTRFNIGNYPLGIAIVLGGIWGAHGEYWEHRGDSIPRKFSRHASAHGVSRRQYSRVNAIISLMHVTGLLKVLESDLP